MCEKQKNLVFSTKIGNMMSNLGIIGSFHVAHDSFFSSFLNVIDVSYCSDIGKMIWSYCGWLRNPAPPKG